MAETIKVTIEQDLSRGPNTWAYAVSFGQKIAAIGYGHNYEAASKLANKGVKNLEKFLKKQLTKEQVTDRVNA